MTNVGVVRLSDSVPYAWPWEGEVAVERCALAVVGAGAWSTLCPVDEAALARLDAIVVAAGCAGMETIVVSHPDGGGRGPTNAPAHPPPTLAISADVELVAVGIDGCYGSGLIEHLRAGRRDHVLLAGFGLEGSVHSTMRTLNDQGIEVLCVVDACLALDPDLRDAAASQIHMSGGIFGATGSAAAVVAALADDPTDPEETS